MSRETTRNAPLGAGIYTAPQGALNRLTFVVPMPPSETNASGASRSWRAKWQKRHAYQATLDALQGSAAFLNNVACLVPPPPPAPFPRCTVRSVMYLGGAMDDDNAMARHKPLLDWLKTRGYIADDRRKNLRWLALPEQVVKRDGKYRIEITLEREDAQEATAA